MPLTPMHARPSPRRAALLAALLAAAAIAPAAASASDDDDALRRACDAPEAWTTLHGPGAWPAAAAATWVGARRLHWPGVTAAPGEAFVLYHAADHGLVARVGAPVRGHDAAFTLAPTDAEVPDGLLDEHLRWPAGLGLAVELDEARLRTLLRGELLLVRQDADGRVLDATRPQQGELLDVLWGHVAADAAERGALRLGAHRVAAGDGGVGSAFALWAPTARRVDLCLYDDARGASTGVVPATFDAATGAWHARVDGDRHGRFSTWLVEVGVPGEGVLRQRVTDPYALGLSADGERFALLDLDDPSTMPAGWADAPPAPSIAANTDQVIYELHVRDFSRDDASVRAAWRGRYLAFAEPASQGVAHLRRLARAGITDVHLLPVYDLGSVPERDCARPAVPAAGPADAAQQAAIAPVRETDCFNWGYDPVHYTAPEGSYATDPDDAAGRVREFRAMVLALHAMGLRVGMDVVYNHTFRAGQARFSVLDRIVPGYYHRWLPDGTLATSTCCPNTATERSMMARLMIDSAVTWAREHRIDSFRFDLMGHQPAAAMRQLQREVDAAAGRRVPLLGEGWNFGEVADDAYFPQARQGALCNDAIGTFSDRARDALRGGSAGDAGDAMRAQQGWINGLHHAPNGHGPAPSAATRDALLHASDLLRAGLAGTLGDYPLHTASGRVVRLSALDYKGQPAGYACQPDEVVNYVENHDNQTLWDLNAMRLPAGTPSAERARLQVLALAYNALSQGVAYFHAGGELLRSKSLDRNSFNSGDHFNAYDPGGATHAMGRGLPPAEDNAASWDAMRPVLLDPTTRATPADIAFARAAFEDWLRIRASTRLLRLRSADEVIARLRFHGTGPDQAGTLLVGELDGGAIDGRALDDAGFGGVLYLLNVADTPASIAIPGAAGRGWRLHPVLAAPGAADARAREDARVDDADGRFTVPARTAVVFVRD